MKRAKTPWLLGSRHKKSRPLIGAAFHERVFGCVLFD